MHFRLGSVVYLDWCLENRTIELLTAPKNKHQSRDAHHDTVEFVSGHVYVQIVLVHSAIKSVFADIISMTWYLNQNTQFIIFILLGVAISTNFGDAGID